MLTIQSAMLVVLGVLIACLAGLLIVPAYYRRTVRLTTERLKRAMPLTEAEIRADKDRIRAEYALAIHDLNRNLEHVTLTSARQRVEINRRDAAISALEGEVARMGTALEEHENARRVLEQTIMDRLPRVEHRLSEARKLLTQRDREITRLSETAERQGRALDEATQINTQSRDDIMRLNAALATRAARNRDGLGDARVDGEIALRSEIEALRARTREQAALIARLQGLMARTGGAVGAGFAASGQASSGTGDAAPAFSGANGSEPIVPRSEEEIARLRRDLAEAEAALRSSRSMGEVGQEGRARLEAEIKALRSANDDKAAEIARLSAALHIYEDTSKNDRSIAESKMALKAKVAALQQQTEDQSQQIQRLKAEIAAANERAARQAAHLMEEMRRLGSGTYPTTAGRPATRGPEVASEPRRTLTDRIAEPRTPNATKSGPGPALRQREPVASSVGGQNADPRDLARASGFLRALGGAGPAAAPPVAAAQEMKPQEAATGTDGAQPQRDAKARRGSLLDRITRIDQAD
ncbi:MAG: hypothetical protein NW205_00300 [Hyphomicrobiaceae bacterium]|nr:hypothetical protein [Hyphomicrobiaceae bacterium]